MKKRCALEATKYIQDGMVVGLGGGRTIAYLVSFIKEKQLDVRVVTPSYETAQLCIQEGLTLLPTYAVDHVDIAFDGCDEVDEALHALKSGGAIHTLEKIIGSMAAQYVLLIDESKLYKTLAFKHSVTIEVLSDSMRYVTKQLKALHGEVSMRKSNAKDGYTISDYGNIIMDVYFHGVEDIEALHQALRNIVGIVETSLFVGVVDMVLCVSEEGIRVIK